LLFTNLFLARVLLGHLIMEESSKCSSCVLISSEGGGEGQSQDCSCVQQGCSSSGCVVTLDGQPVVWPFVSDDVLLPGRLAALAEWIENPEIRNDIKTESGSYQCPECEELFDGDDDIVQHLLVEREVLEERCSASVDGATGEK
jgi:hypothetical protein